jgi:hypothetical protein
METKKLFIFNVKNPGAVNVDVFFPLVHAQVTGLGGSSEEDRCVQSELLPDLFVQFFDDNKMSTLCSGECVVIGAYEHKARNFVSRFSKLATRQLSEAQINFPGVVRVLGENKKFIADKKHWFHRAYVKIQQVQMRTAGFTLTLYRVQDLEQEGEPILFEEVHLEGAETHVDAVLQGLGHYVELEYMDIPSSLFQRVWGAVRENQKSIFKMTALHAIDAHDNRSVEPRKCFRKYDMQTPMYVHPTWCAMTLMHETSLSYEMRERGALALQLHDVLEDTTAGLPEGLSEDVVRLVEEMTFESYGAELDSFWKISKEAQLLKLYDKVSNLMDGAWMSPEKRAIYIAYTKLLTQKARENYGELNVVKIAEAICF